MVGAVPADVQRMSAKPDVRKFFIEEALKMIKMESIGDGK